MSKSLVMFLVICGAATLVCTHLSCYYHGRIIAFRKAMTILEEGKPPCTR